MSLPENNKKFEFDSGNKEQRMSDTECCPKADFFPKPNFPKFPNCGFNTRHDNREVTLIEFFESRICRNILSEYLPNVPKCGLNTRHDNREVTLIHLTRAQTLRSDKLRHRFNPCKRVHDYQRYPMLTVLSLRSMSCTLGNSYSL